jgi:hypothetical protein
MTEQTEQADYDIPTVEVLDAETHTPSKAQPTVAIIPCTSQKAATGGPAREVWSGAHFQLVLAHAEWFYDKVLIMSYKYGLIEPGFVIEPYDINIKYAPAAAKLKWWYKLQGQIRELVQEEDPQLVALYTGNFERERIIREFVKAGCLNVILPWPHATVGQRMQLVYDGEPPFLLEDLHAGKYRRDPKIAEAKGQQPKAGTNKQRTPQVVDEAEDIEWED